MSNGTQGSQGGIIPRAYKSGSIVYMEGDKSDNIYIMKSGRVILTTKKVEDRIWVEVKENVKPGEFFGVKSALGRYPRDETAQTFGDTVVLVLSLAEFERLILKNLNVVKKMLRVFSNQLRRIGKTVREVLGETDAVNPEVELFKIGEYYYKAGRHKQALHAYKKYIEFYPGNKHSGVAKQRISALQSGHSGDDDLMSGDEDEYSTSSYEESAGDMTDFSLDDEAGGSSFDDFADDSGSRPERSPLSSEMDEFLMDEDSGESSDDLSDFSFDEPDTGVKQKQDDINELFYEAMRLFSEESFSEAKDLYEKVLNFKSLKNEGERKTFEKAHFEVGRCYYKIKNYREALNSFSALLKKFPTSDHAKNTMLYIGIVFEENGNADKAAGYYKKASEMEPKDQINKEAVNRLARLQKNQGRR
ncbi:MAG TPA: tetratricopeptide repeat protein [Spirochaetota bacterium]|nr:tetratricopeptide repeat protein [Spirochaetota bacterium]